MNLYKLCVLILAFITLGIRPALAQHFQTSLGVQFEAVNDPMLGTAWKSPDGKIWSKAIGFLKYKDALVECKKLGAHVPTLEEYKVLRSYFEMRAGLNVLSEKGLSELLMLFPDLKSYNYFWTSTLVTESSNTAFILDGVYGTLGSGVMETYIEVYTQCVSLLNPLK